MSSVPIRLRLTVGFAVVMAAVLAAMGLFVYFRVGGEQLSSVDASLRDGAAETARHLGRDDGERLPFVDPDAVRGETLAQLIGPGGRLVGSTPPGLRPLLDRKTVAGVERGCA